MTCVYHYISRWVVQQRLLAILHHQYFLESQRKLSLEISGGASQTTYTHSAPTSNIHLCLSSLYLTQFKWKCRVCWKVQQYIKVSPQNTSLCVAVLITTNRAIGTGTVLLTFWRAQCLVPGWGLLYLGDGQVGQYLNSLHWIWQHKIIYTGKSTLCSCEAT